MKLHVKNPESYRECRRNPISTIFISPDFILGTSTCSEIPPELPQTIFMFTICFENRVLEISTYPLRFRENCNPFVGNCSCSDDNSRPESAA